YYRFQIDLPETASSALDNASRKNLSTLIDAAEGFFDDPQARHELDSFCLTLTALTAEKAKSREERIANGSYEVALCYADQDLDVAVKPLAEALRSSGIDPLFEEFSLAPQVSIRRRISQATERAMFSVVVLSPNFLRNQWADSQLEWLYE